MQVLIDDGDFRKMRSAAKRNGMSLAEWVRQVLREKLRTEPTTVAARKLAALRAGMKHSFPTCDIEQMLSEIEEGYEQQL